MSLSINCRPDTDYDGYEEHIIRWQKNSVESCIILEIMSLILSDDKREKNPRFHCGKQEMFLLAFVKITVESLKGLEFPLRFGDINERYGMLREFSRQFYVPL